jgi:dephospho-CoA kinase
MTKCDKIVLGLVGDLAAGKSTVSKYLKEKYGVNAYLYSQMLRDILKRVYIEQSRENLQKLSTLLRENFDQQIMGKVIAKDVQNDPNEIVIADGIRRPSDIVQLEELPGFNLIYVTADPKIRWQRQTSRNQNPGDAEKTFEQFTQDEKSDVENPIKELGKQAKYTLTNNGTQEEFVEQIEKMLKKIKL